MMDVYVATPTLQTIAIIDYCNSIIWHEKFCGMGDFEIALPASPGINSIFTKDNLVYRDDNETVMIVEKIKLTTSYDEGDQIIISGRSCDALIARRIVWGQQTLSGTVSQCVKTLLDNNLINPSDPARKIELLEMGESTTIPQTLQKQITGDGLLDTIIESLNNYSLGYKVSMDHKKSDGKLFFHITQGTDRSEGNTEGNPVVKFSPEFDNLPSSEYEFDNSKYKNEALIGGEGEGSARKYVAVGGHVGLDRYELFVDARSTSSNNGDITPEVYLAQLAEEGREKLSENSIVETFAGEIEECSTYCYGKDYFLGDIVEIENAYGIGGKVRITDVTEKLDDSGHAIVVEYENV